MTTLQIIRRIKENRAGRRIDGTVSSTLLDQLTARIARREARMKYRAGDRWAKQDSEIQLPPAA